MFGWFLSGSRTHTTITDNTSVHQFSVQVSNDCLNDQVRCLWELDFIGIQDIQKRRMSARDDGILTKFPKDYKTEDNQRVVSLIWKTIVTPMSLVIVEAKNKFHSLQKRLVSRDVLKTQYNKCMLNYIEQKHVETNKEFHKSTTTVLGIDWDTNDNTLGNAFKTSFCVAGGKPLTKRWLLRCIASCYDPLGLFSPFMIIGKILFKDTWILGIKWDELLPANLSTMWFAAVKQPDDICSIKISRYIGIFSHTPYTVHVFSDASERAYGSFSIKFSYSLQSKQTSTNQKVTLPSLELLAALMGTRLLKYFFEEVDIQSSAATLWTDSKITLSWIRSDPNKWKTFVRNRTTEYFNILNQTNGVIDLGHETLQIT
ncbi:integrase catalytic domain-containing protein [Nephila pilipes]|uniref:Integrase catalytic domain-containing protein n=1 Tax=Nephila pilipes TaxID=299642 RepID=A0A8X6NZT2_NEPPI|nr:integrase catalytic domain-containing protein [Nephila pilipes]